MMSSTRKTGLVTVLGSLLVAAPAHGAAMAEVSRRSLAEAFLVSRHADGSIELLGSAIIGLLLVLSVLSVGLMGHAVMANRRATILPPKLVESMRQHLAAGRSREAMDTVSGSTDFFGRIMHAALHESSHGYGAMVRGLEQAADELSMIRFRHVEYLNVVGQVSPMIGLFGTVYGMILAFQGIVVGGGNPDPVLLAGGIGTALTTTFWGLVVAIPSLAGYAIIRNRIDELATEAVLTAEQLLNRFRPGGDVAPRGDG